MNNKNITEQKNIILTTLNSRFSHSSLSLRYLFANLKELKENAKILEFVINSQNQTIAEEILQYKPKIVLISTYIWNVSDVKELVNYIKLVSPQTIVALGGPEISHLPHRVDLEKSDYFMFGEGEISVYNLCKSVLGGFRPKDKIIHAKPVEFDKIALPYDYYTDFDIKNRHIYIESSRGCPFTCEFCLSSIDSSMRYLPMDIFLQEIDKLWNRGARNYKFIDRTFNLKISYAKAILEYFLAKDEEYFLHFEVIPDNFPPELRELLKQFKAGSLQLEVGIQTLNLDVAKQINRNLRMEKIKDNLAFLSNETKAHMHIDLIVGLPSETIESFASNLDLLYTLSSGEIQIGILKKLSGTTLNRHDEVYGMVYNPFPPYDILQNDLIPFQLMQDMKRFARFWDIVYNSGNFMKTSKLLFKDGKVFDGFFAFSKWIYKRSESTHKISLDRVAEYLFEYLSRDFEEELLVKTILEDVMAIKGRKIPPFLKKFNAYEQDFIQIEQSKAQKRQVLRMETNE